MILVNIVDTEDGVRVTSDGHAEESPETQDAEDIRVCAAVSYAMVSLATHTTRGPIDAAEGGGRVVCYVPEKHLPLAEFTVSSLVLLARSYGEKLRVTYTGRKLFREKDTRAWLSLTIPAPPTKTTT